MPCLTLSTAFHKSGRILPVVVLAIALFAALSSSAVMAQENLKKVSFMPQWVPQAQFAGYMVAFDKGFYREEGLDVDLRNGGPGKDGFEALFNEELTFCTGWLASAVARRGSGIPLVNIAQVLQHSGLMLVAMKSSGIRRLEDLNGKRLGFWTGEFYVPIRVLIKRRKLNVQLIPNYTTITIFLKHAVDAVAAMWFNEYHSILNSGFDPNELTVFRLSDLGLDFPEDGVYCAEKTFRADPEMCKAFARASLKGWAYAFSHQDEALDIVMKYARKASTGTNRAHQRWMLERIKDLADGGKDPAALGKLDRGDYLRVGKALRNISLVDKLPEYEEFYRGPR